MIIFYFVAINDGFEIADPPNVPKLILARGTGAPASNNILLQGDKLYLKAINTGFILLDLGTNLLSEEHLPKVLGVSSSYTNMRTTFRTRYQICHSMVNTASPHSPVRENILTTVDRQIVIYLLYRVSQKKLTPLLFI
jgi:hypothetical protein